MTNCKCDVRINRSVNAHEIVYCPKHAAAPEMFEALTGLVNTLPDCVIDWARDGIGNSNAGAIIHWRDRGKAAIDDK